jgi:hypothetical protein
MWIEDTREYAQPRLKFLEGRRKENRDAKEEDSW